MFEASVDGEAYDPDRFGQYFRAPGMSAPTGDPNKAATPSASKTVEETKVETPAAQPATQEPVAQPTTTSTETDDKPSSERAQDILKMIRERQS